VAIACGNVPHRGGLAQGIYGAAQLVLDAVASIVNLIRRRHRLQSALDRSEDHAARRAQAQMYRDF
jgi:hypothetical protein